MWPARDRGAAKDEGRPASASSPLRTCQVQNTGYFFLFAAFFFVPFFFAAFFFAIRDHLLRSGCEAFLKLMHTVCDTHDLGVARPD